MSNISYTDSSLWIPILEGYKHPTHLFLDETIPKPISRLDEDEKKAYDREKKAHGSITMALTRELFHSFRGYDTSKDLWKALQKRFKGNSDVKKSKIELLRKQYECFRYLENESIDELISRFYHLNTELKSYEMKYPGKVQSHDMNLKKKERSGRPQIQDPSMYFGVSSTAKSSGSEIALFSRTLSPTSTSSANQTAIAKIAEVHVELFSFCMLAYENFIGGKQTDPKTIEEDFNQVDPDDMEDIDIQWNLAMILRRAKRFLNRFGRKFIGGHSNAKGHNQSYNSQNNRSQTQGTSSNALVVQQDDSFDWGVYLEDAIISQTQLGLMAEIVDMMKDEE
ncbi:hypothetical protein L1987_08808 [Smallanthus sonchifolius]|uniref:Uncharacterized protein n=1 Tax=Smallanthus sonchifolius TaxID=185202 RepID=A0ACB9JNC7_9ASTR|nr:hypothetical protein L1987_08808 [Smallanthus sonchifolius]